MAKYKVGDVLEAKSGSTYTIIRYENSRDITIRFNDEYGFQMKTKSSSFKTGMMKNPYHRSVRGVGFFGVGEFVSHKSGRHTKEYTVWQSMIERCYAGLDRFAAYADCTVHEDWHNFQNFAKWYTSNEYYGKSGYHLDKDILVSGNRVYSPDTCLLVPSEINQMFEYINPTHKGEVLGISFNDYSKKYLAHICMGNETKFLGSFKTKDLAHAAYIEFKKLYFRNMAIVHRDSISTHVFDILFDWQHKA